MGIKGLSKAVIKVAWRSAKVADLAPGTSMLLCPQSQAGHV